MVTERSPLLRPVRSAALSINECLDIPNPRGFTTSNERRASSVVIGSSGRVGFVYPSDIFPGTDGDGDFDQDYDDDDDDDNDDLENGYLRSDDANRLVNIRSIDEARTLLRDQEHLLSENNIIYPNKGGSASGSRSRLSRQESLASIGDDIQRLSDVWVGAIDSGKITTNWYNEFTALVVTSIPLAITFLLQNSLSVASIFVVSHLGKTELGAVTLGSMTANITGLAAFQGMATALDTLCSQSYGAGKYKQVGVHFQRCTALMLTVFLGVSLIWWFSYDILTTIVDEKELAYLASRYLRIMIIGAPGYILFETGKKFLQSQGIFKAGTYVLIICAPLNAILNYVLVWNKHIGVGYLGAPIAVVINYWLMTILLYSYIYFIDGYQCWNGFEICKAFQNWNRLSKLVIPGVVTVEAEFLAFELLTLASSKFGLASLAAQSVIATIGTLAYQVPFSISVAASTRIANLVGATLVDAAKIATTVSLIMSVIGGAINCTILYLGRFHLARWFTNEPEVISLIVEVLPIIAILQVGDGLNAVSAGALRGQGRQQIAGYLNLMVYYAIALPLGLSLAFTFGWKLKGLWIGNTLGLVMLGIVQTFFLLRADWPSIIAEARGRNVDERIIAH